MSPGGGRSAVNSLRSITRGLLNAPLNRGRPISALARFVGWQLRARLFGGGVVPFVNGARLHVRKGMRGATGNVYRGLHEFKEMGFALHLLRPGDVFLDVGANVGTYSILAWSVGAHPHAFEPGERYDDLVEQFRLNHVDGKTYQAAVGATPGTISFTRQLDTVGRPSLPGEESVEVPLVTLDRLVPAEIPPPALIKIDVEGYESAVIAGAEQLLRRTPPLAVIMEVGQGTRFGFDDTSIAQAMVRDYGFEAMTYDPFTRTLTPAAIKSNVIYVRPAAHERIRSAPPFRVWDHVI